MKKPALIFLIFVLTGCIFNPGPPPSVVGLYSEASSQKQDIPGSNAQARLTRVLEFTQEEVFEAGKQAMLRLGYNTEVSKESTGFIAASGIFMNCGGNRPAITMGIYIKQLNSKPETEIVVLLDRHDWQCHGSGERKAANGVLTEIQKILSTY